MSSGLKVLVVDDETDVCALVRHYLKKSLPDASIVTAANGAEGLASFRALQPDVVISNNHMPVMDGPEMIAQLRALGAVTPIISISNAPDAEQRALAAGASAFLNKTQLKMLPEVVSKLSGQRN